MKIAIEGCCHGELDKIYETISCLEKKEGVKVDLLLCCGDFQAVRNEGEVHGRAGQVQNHADFLQVSLLSVFLLRFEEK